MNPIVITSATKVTLTRRVYSRTTLKHFLKFAQSLGHNIVRLSSDKNNPDYYYLDVERMDLYIHFDSGHDYLIASNCSFEVVGNYTATHKNQVWASFTH